MSTSPIDQAPPKPLRLWPGVVIVAVQWLLWLLLPLIKPEAAPIAMLAGMAGALLILVWWLFFSRAPWLERIAVIILMVVAVVATKRVVHPSIAGGMMGMMLIAFSLPVLSLALVGWAVSTQRLSPGLRRVSLVIVIVLACAVFTLIRTGGITGNAASDIHWRWTRTPEEELLAKSGEEPSTSASSAANMVGADANWPGFRGAKRDGVVRGVRIDTSWRQKPPTEIWRKPIGPGWSSFAVGNNLIYTQEQRGDNEEVSCYELGSGAPVWRHKDATRFYESNGGAGPRGTPTLHNGRVYTFGATGILNALDAGNGSVVWTRNAASDTKTKTPTWGFASSPLVVGDVVIIATSGVLAAYDAANGTPRWYGPPGGRGYSSPHLLSINGVDQVLLLTSEGTISVAPTDGKLLWKDPWAGDSIVQPATTFDGDVLIGSGSGIGAQVGVHRIGVAYESGGWTTKERWTSYELNPYFNDFVVHQEHAFGFDGSELACIDLKDGAAKWKGGSYGHGQLILLSDQNLLLVVSEKGEMALVKASPDQFTELARFKAIEGKTWNHPVIVGSTLLVRNDQEMAAFRMTLEEQ